MKFSTEIASCRNLKPMDMREFAEERSSLPARRLLDRFEQVARPNDGVEIVLFLFVAIAVRARWLPDRLNVAITADGNTSTKLDLIIDGGGGVRERMWRRYRFAVPIEEFEPAAIRMSKHAKTPFDFSFDHKRDGQRLSRIMMRMDRSVRAVTLPPARSVLSQSPQRLAPPPSVRLSHSLETEDIDSQW